jgi:hypothetical protein
MIEKPLPQSDRLVIAPIRHQGFQPDKGRLSLVSCAFRVG